METKFEKPVVLVTGSAGLIGSRVVKALSSNFKVVGLDQHCRKLKRKLFYDRGVW